MTVVFTVLHAFNTKKEEELLFKKYSTRIVMSFATLFESPFLS